MCAVLQGADYVEFDVQLSKDMKPVIFHDFVVSLSLKKVRTINECITQCTVAPQIARNKKYQDNNIYQIFFRNIPTSWTGLTFQSKNSILISYKCYK